MAKLVRILAMGDSLTAGYHSYGLSYHPYANNLSNLLNSLSIQGTIDQKGVSGEQVVPTMVNRLSKVLEASKTDPYDWIIILGGTNDLGYRKSAETIFLRGLKQMYDMVLAYNNGKTRLVAMTVIENAVYSPTNVADMPRQQLNHFIRSFCKDHPEKNRIYLVDLDQGIPYHRLTDENRRDLIWDDSIHLKPAGYDHMATLIFQTIRNDIRQ